MATVRASQKTDSTKLDSLLGTKRGADDPNTYTHVLEDGGVKGAAVWIAPAGGPAMLGAVSLVAGWEQKDIYRLVLATAEAALKQGFKRAIFTLHSESLLRVIEQTFTNIDVRVVGIDPKTRKGVEWTVEVDLPDAIAQLKVVIGG